MGMRPRPKPSLPVMLIVACLIAGAMAGRLSASVWPAAADDPTATLAHILPVAPSPSPSADPSPRPSSATAASPIPSPSPRPGDDLIAGLPLCSTPPEQLTGKERSCYYTSPDGVMIVSLPEGMSPCPSTPEKPSSPWASCSDVILPETDGGTPIFSLPYGTTPCPSTPEKPSSPWTSCGGFAEAPALSLPPGAGPCRDVSG